MNQRIIYVSGNIVQVYPRHQVVLLGINELLDNVDEKYGPRSTSPVTIFDVQDTIVSTAGPVGARETTLAGPAPKNGFGVDMLVA